MKNATYLGLCLLAVAVGWAEATYGQQTATSGTQSFTQPAQPGQQPATPPAPQNPQPASPGQQPGAQSQQPGATDTPLFDRNTQPGSADRKGAMPAPSGQPNRSLLSGPQQPDAGGSKMTGTAQPRGQLGVWLIGSGGPGVQVARITGGSAAERAGLRSGDIILQVNGRGASSPDTAARMIRQIPIGQAATLTIWRDGDQQQLQFAMEPARESYEVGFRGQNSSPNGDLAARTAHLEQQVAMVLQELQQLRQDMAQLRSSGGQATGIGAQPIPGTAPESSLQPPSKNGIAPPPGFGTSNEKGAPPVSGTTNPSGTSPATDPFGSAAPPPKSEPTPKAGTETKTGTDADSLFK